MRNLILAVICVLAMAACTPTATNESRQIAEGQYECKQGLNRGWLTDQSIEGYHAKCDPKTGKIELIVDKQSQSAQSEIVKSLSEGVTTGVLKGLGVSTGAGAAPAIVPNVN